MSTVVQDIRYALRTFRRRPGLTAAALVTLALGIGANTAVFSVARAVLVPDLPFPEPDQIVNVYVTRQGHEDDNVATNGIFGVWQASSDETFSALAAHSSVALSLSAPNGPRRVRAARTSPALFAVIGTPPLLGRTLSAGDEVPGTRTVVLSHGLWTAAFGSNPEVVNSTVRIDGEPWTVVGVMPFGSNLPSASTEAWVPLTLSQADLVNFSRHYLSVLGRLRPGVTIDEATAELSASQARLGPPHDTGAARLVGLATEVAARVRRPLLLLHGITIAILVIASVNVAILLAAESTGRVHEMAVRRAVGASRRRIGRQLLTEHLVLAGSGALLGVGLAAAAAPALAAAYPPGLPLGLGPQIGGMEVVATSVFVVIATAIFGVTPAMIPGGAEALRGTPGAPRPGSLTGGALVTSQVALTFLVLVGGGLLAKSFLRLTTQPLTFDPARVLTGEFVLPQPTYDTLAERARFIAALTARLAETRGIRRVAVSSAMPFGGSFSGGAFRVYQGDAELTREMFFTRSASAGYLDVLQAELLSGRFLSDQDTNSTDRVAVVNEHFAATVGRPVVGLRVRQGPGDPWITIVGVVRNTRADFTMETHSELTMAAAQTGPARFHVLLRTDGNPMHFVEPLRAVVRALDSDLSVEDISSLEAMIRASVAGRRFNMAVVVLLAGLAGSLAWVGIYSVTASVAGRRTREAGIRMALGARAGQVRWLLIREGTPPLVVGILLGITGAYWAVRLLESELFDLAPRDPATFSATAVMFLGTGLIALWLPAGRAAAADPAVTLRAE